MNRDFIDDVLSSNSGIEPGADFTETVMRAVRRDAMLPPIAFPWLRFLIGVGGIAATTAAIVFTEVPAPAVTATDPLALSAASLLVTWCCYAAGARLVRTPD